MNQDPVTVTNVDWLKLLPWLNLWHAARMGFRLRILLPACLLLLCSLAGPQIEHQPHSVMSDLLPSATKPLERTSLDLNRIGFESFVRLPRPVAVAVRGGSELAVGREPRWFQACSVVVWNVLLIGLFGVAIARSTATEFCDGSRTGGIAALRFTIRHLSALFLSTAIAAFLVAIPLLPLLAMAWITKTLVIGTVGYTVFGIPATIAAAALLLAAVVCPLGWLLSIGAIGTDQCSGSDALSRGISYVLSHKVATCWHLLMLIVVAGVARLLAIGGVIGAASVLLARFPGHADTIPGIASPDSADYSPIPAVWTYLLHLPDIVHLGTFLSGLTIMYLLLRQAEDAVQLREIDGGSLSRAKFTASANNSSVSTNT
ncbi:MAG: hypothetical protein R3C59_30650 [Planctomycetaceae bacterium]